MNPLTYIRFVTAGLLYVFLFVPLLWLSGWLCNAQSAWDKIPAEDKIYSVVRDDEAQVYDGIVHNEYSSMASHIDKQLQTILNKVRNGLDLTQNEQLLLKEHNEARFKPSDTVVGKEKYRGPHFISRQDLVAALGHQEPYNNHDYFLNKLKDKFMAERPIDNAKQDTPIAAMPQEKPLILACSGGAGHISAAKGVINALCDQNPDVIITNHEPVLYHNHPFSFSGWFIRLGIWLASSPVIGPMLNKILHMFNGPAMPDYAVFWSQMSKLHQSEVERRDGVEAPKNRPYVDVFLDIYPSGYEATAYNNAAHLSLPVSDIANMTTYKGSFEGHSDKIVHDNILQRLMTAAKNGAPYTKLISTQALSLQAICKAALEYNNTFLPKFNAAHGTTYLPIPIDMYLTDLPSMGCAHFMDNIENIGFEERQLVNLYTVYMSKPVKTAYFGEGHGFKAIHEVDPRNNPMVRKAFKEESLKSYTETEKPHTVTYKDSAANKTMEIKANAKVASIMIGSLAANASVDYVKHLLNANYDAIFVFGGLNDEIAHQLDELIASYPQSKQEEIRLRVIRLGNQTDVEMAPIFTRSNCVVIRGGGLSVMEQMAMPLTKDKVVLMHHEDNESGELTSGLGWEDSNTERLIDYLTEKNAYATKTSPSLCSKGLAAAEAFYAKTMQSSESLPTDKPAVPQINETQVPVPNSQKRNEQNNTGDKLEALNQFGLFKPDELPKEDTINNLPTLIYTP